MSSMESTPTIPVAAAGPAPSMDGEWQVIMEVEACLAAAAALLFFQLICGSFRRQSNNFFIQRGLWLGYTLLIPLTSYTLGLMQSSPAKTRLYPVWALSLLLIGGGANSITAYEIDDNKQWMRRAFNVVQIFVYFIIGPKVYLRTVTCRVSFIMLSSTLLFAHAYGIAASFMANDSDDSKAVADYMKYYYYHSSCNSGGVSISRQQEFLDTAFSKYLVLFPDHYDKMFRWGVNRPELRKSEYIVTLEQIWVTMGSEDWFISHGLSPRVKGACLSYSLSHLLKCRFFGINGAKSHLPEGRRFILEWLLSDNNTDENTEAFRVIAAELAFLYDFFYTKYFLVFRCEAQFFLVATLKIICTLILGLCLIYHTPLLVTSKNEVEFPVQFRDVRTTVGVLVALLLVELLQMILYLGSDWAMVSLCCGHRSYPDFLGFTIRKKLWLLVRHPVSLYWRHCNRYWLNKLGQYSVIQGSQFVSRRKFNKNWTRSKFISAGEYIRKSFFNLISTKGLHYVLLPETLKPEIVSLLKSNTDGRLTNGNAALQRNGVFGFISSTFLHVTTQTEKMLIWHIATEYCRIASPAKATAVAQAELATKLSRYCAYLMSEAPGLLPGSSVDTKFLFDHAIYEARQVLGSKSRDRLGLLEARAALTSTDDSIFARGLKLGTELGSIQDHSLRWKAMAEFWIETILYVAPSDDAKAHMERLAQGGEFLTHLWALLTHAGIMTRNEEAAPAPAGGVP